MVLVAAEHSDGDLAHHQKWIDVLEARGQVVFLVAPSAAPLRAERHVATRADTADTLRAMAEAVTGVAAPVLLVDAGSVGSPITVEEMVESTGTVSQSAPAPSGSVAVPQTASLPERTFHGRY